MELHDGDLVLRPWADDDVDAIVAGCNDPDVARWIPTIPHPYTEEDARAFIRGEVRPEHQALAIELDGQVVGGIGIGLNAHGYRGTIGYWMAARLVAGERAHVRCGCLRDMRSTCSSSSASICSRILTTSLRSVSLRRSVSCARVCSAPISDTRTAGSATR